MRLTGLALWAVAVTFFGPSTTAQPSYGVAAIRDVMVAMRDGVSLATDVYLPTANGAVVSTKLPAILQRTPYKKERDAGAAELFVPHGYAVVMQDVRGRYKSGGRWRPIADDPTDGADTARWIGTQRWSNGSIGTIGTSYAGATQHALAIADAPFVRTMIPVDAMSNFGRYGVRHNGAFELRFFNWVLTMGNAAGTPNAALAAERAAADPSAAGALVELGTRVREDVRGLPLRPGTTPLKFAPDYEAWLIEAMRHGDYDDFWKNHGASVVDHLHAGGLLAPEKPVARPPTVYLFDPKNPVPTLGGNLSSQGALMFQGAADQRSRADFWLCSDMRPLSERNDVLVFQTPPLDRDIEVTGRLIVKLWAATDGPDTDFTAKLIDVYPPRRDFPNGVDLNVAPASYGRGIVMVVGRSPRHPVSRTSSRSRCTRPRSSSRADIESGWTSRAATSRASTSTRTPVNRSTTTGGGEWHRTPSYTSPSVPRTSCCRSFPIDPAHLGSTATARSGAPLPPFIFIGEATGKAPAWRQSIERVQILERRDVAFVQQSVGFGLATCLPRFDTPSHAT